MRKQKMMHLVISRVNLMKYLLQKNKHYLMMLTAILIHNKMPNLNKFQDFIKLISLVVEFIENKVKALYYKI